MSETAPQVNTGARHERFSAGDLRVLLIWILAGAIGAGVAWKYFFQAFPEASVKFQISSQEASRSVGNFLTEHGASLAGYESTIVFTVDDKTKTYLERTVGLEQANRLISSEVNAWAWEIRYFRPQQKEEYRAEISPAGKIVGYEHVIDEARAGARLDRDAAEAIAKQFLLSQYKAELAAFEFLPEEASATERPNRRDWIFTWQRRGFRVPDTPEGARYRLRVGLQGDHIARLEEFLKVPDAWARDYDRMRSGNNLIELIAIIPYLLLIGAAFLMIYEYSRRGLLRWAGPMWVGVFLALLFFLMTLNAWPATRAGYDTNSSYASFTVEQVAIALALSVIQAVLVTLAVAPGEPLYRQSYPARLRLGISWKLPAMRSKEFFNSCVIGISLAAVHLGYVVAFYLIGKRFGVWAPADISYDSNAGSSIVPWLAPFTIGVYAAMSEEFLFRMFAIPFLKRITKSTFLAVVLPAFAWGFLHANYPQEPPYIRGIEIGIIGIVAGLVMLRWGILPTLIWHYTVDATLGSLLLMRSASPYLRISGALVAGAAALPLLYAAVMYFARGGFEAREELLNSADPLRPSESAGGTAADSQEAGDAQEIAEPAPARKHTSYEALSQRAIWTLVLCGAAGIAALVGAKTQGIGDFVRVTMDRKQVAARADDVLRQWHVDPARYHRVVIFLTNFDPLANEFLRRKAGIEGANRIYEQQVPQVFWRARYFLDSEAEEYAVLFRMDGGVHSLWHTLEESAAGAKLTREEALARAEAWLRDNKQMRLADWKLVDSKTEAKPKRADHTFVWEAKAPLAGGPGTEDAAFARVELQVQGDEISHFRNYVKLPEEWVRQQQEGTLAKTIQKVWRILFYAGGSILLLVIYFKNLRQPAAAAIPWRRLAGWTLWGFAALAVSTVANLPITLHNYVTSIPLTTFYATVGIVSLLVLVVFSAAISFLFGLAWFFWTRAGRGEDLPGWFGMPRSYYRDAFLLAIAGSAAWMGLGKLLTYLNQHWATLRADLPSAAPNGFDALSPASQSIASGIFGGLLFAGGIAVLAGFIAVSLRPLWMRALLVLGAAAALVGGWGNTPDFARQLLFWLVLILFAWWGVARTIRFNLLGLFLIVATGSLLIEGTSLIQQPNSYLHTHGVIVLVALVLLLAWPLVAWLKPASIEQTNSH